MITNAVLDAIRNRRSVREFEDRPIAEEHLAALLDAAVWAPSGHNSQSWLFTAVRSKDVLSRINSLVKDGFQRWIPDDDYPAKQTVKARSESENYNFYYHAPVLIIASNRKNYENAMADCALALENIFLTAQSLGLGSCYINQLHWLRDDTPLRKYLFSLGVPEEHTICSSAAVGYARKIPEPPERKTNTALIV